MNGRNVLIVVGTAIAVIVLSIAAVAWMAFSLWPQIGGGSSGNEQEVAVSARQITKGAQIEDDDIEAVKLPADDVPVDAVLFPSTVIGYRARVDIPQGKNILLGDIAGYRAPKVVEAVYAICDIDKGDVIDGGSLAVRRMNAADVPAEAVPGVGYVLGRTAKKAIGASELVMIDDILGPASPGAKITAVMQQQEIAPYTGALIDALKKRGTAYQQENMPDLAVKDFSEAIKLDPKDADLYRCRAFSYVALNNHQAALHDCDAAVALKPDLQEVHMLRGFALENLGEDEKAIAAYSAAIKIDPDDESGYTTRADAFTDMGEYAKAIADYNAAIKLDADDSSAYNGRAWSNAMLGKYDAALPDVEKALALAPDYAEALDTRGYVQYGLGQYDAALASLDRALKLESGMGDAHFHKSLIYEKQGKHDLAAKEKATAKQLGYDT